jgi:beta-phosphoglucomutase-like phosphatase (HAD superfamily)
VLAVEDDPRGIMSAKAAGLFTAAITTRHSHASLETLAVAPDVTVDSYATLLSKLT